MIRLIKLFSCVLLLIFVSGCQKNIEILPDYTAQIIAHRGLWNVKGGVQNSLSSYKAAIDAGLSGAETDVRQTKDGVLVLCHDGTYNDKVIKDSNYSELTGITTLEELLEIVKSAPTFKIIIEIKRADCSEVVNLIDKIGVSYNQIVFFSFEKNYCRDLIKMDRGFNIAYLNGDFTPETLKEAGYSGMSYSYSQYYKDKTLVSRAKNLGLDVYAWTVNKYGTMVDLLDMGCDYIITDIPLELLK